MQTARLLLDHGASPDAEYLWHGLTTPFTAMVGELDTMYGRYERNQKFKAEIEQLREGRSECVMVSLR